MQMRFSYQAPTAGKHEVGIAGDFTGWKIFALQEMGDKYLISFNLEPGLYRYKYIVDGVWQPDPSHFQRETDPFGGENSLVRVAADAKALSWAEAVASAAQEGLRSLINITRYAMKSLELRFKWPAALAEQVELLIEGEELPLRVVGKIGGECYWHIDLELEDAVPVQIAVYHQGKRLYLGASVQEESAGEYWYLDYEDYPLFELPDWVAQGTIYQIFMDRFCNGDARLNQDFSESYYRDLRTPPAPGTYLQANQEYYHFIPDWYEVAPLKQSQFLPEGKPDWWCFYGGDIAGVRSKLNYLAELGVNILYFNPLWEAKSVHKYDAADFEQVDPHFGTAVDLKSLVKEAQARGMRVILDVAFNHSGESFWAFKDCVEKGEASEYWNWYDWHKWPLPQPLPIDFKPREYYQCWWGIKDMPDLNYDLARRHPEENYIRHIEEAEVNSALVEHILEAAAWWIEYIGMDGFRLDVPEEVPYWFWELFRKRIKRIKPDAWLVGEIWHNASAWISPLYFDSVMNYAYFNSPVLEYFIHLLADKAEFQKRILEGLAVYPTRVARAMMNLLGSHDTQRIYSLAKGDIARVKQAIFFQMSFIGTPHIYYGDEIALPGTRDPDNRRPFNWRWQESAEAVDLREYYRRLIALRQAQPLLVEGEFEFVELGEGVLAYRRYLGEESLYCVINRGEDECRLQAREILFSEGGVRQEDECVVLAAGALCIYFNHRGHRERRDLTANQHE